MKKIVLLVLFTIVCNVENSIAQMRLPGSDTSPSQQEGVPVDFDKEQQLKKDIDDVGLSVANQLMRCCSSFGGNNVYSKVFYDDVRYNSVTGAFVIPMQIGWYGSFTGMHYWIIGKLVVNKDNSKEWLKIRDSGAFNPGCSKDCIK
ncbi:hypothetical protein [Capnocytophaga canimorsus]|uniref:hypothetical protein n=1 Tax=Capnocytophaga canimorsus TaxID=28188 RepID=UPI000F6D5689|nr:hypothetical protein [Capnocytophaga canimorsus]VEJ19386.1 Uncharacterised protein [Capnocytophaga canimorsus]